MAKMGSMKVPMSGDKLNKCVFLKNKVVHTIINWYEAKEGVRVTPAERTLLEEDFIEACYADFPTFEPIYVARWLELKCGWPAYDQEFLTVLEGILVAFNEAYPPPPE